jgi:hypothetical protein
VSSDGLRTEQGILSVDAQTYHSDAIADVPSLSASVAVTMIQKSPLHAFTAHPRLNPAYVAPDAKTEWDVGTAAHSLLLEGNDVAYIVEGYDNFKTKAAQLERDEAREAGKIPMLRHQWEEVIAMVDAARAWIAVNPAYPPLLSDGKPEVTVAAVVDGVTCRSRIDWLRDDLTVIDDYKTSRSAEQVWFSERGIYDNGYDVRAAFYLRILKAATGADAIFRWIVQEKKPPYAMSVNTPGPDVLAQASDKVSYALRTWKRCMETGVWPSYDPRVATAELPGWEETRWLERTLAA